MAGFDNMSTKKLKKTTKKGGLASAEARKNKNKTFEDVVVEKMDYKTLSDMYKGLVDSGKKGNVKAVETLLFYLEKNRRDKELEEQKKKDRFKL